MAQRVPVIDDARTWVSFEDKRLQDLSGVSLGASPASTGTVRMSHSDTLVANSTDGLSDLTLLAVDGSDNMVLLDGAVTLSPSGVATGLDADLLDGQEGSFYQDASNLSTGSLDPARMPGGGTWVLSSTLFIEDDLGASFLEFDHVNTRIGLGVSPTEFLDVGGNTRIRGDLIIDGSTVTVSSEEVEVADNILTLNSNVTSGTPTENAGIKISRGGSTASQILWNESSDEWQAGTVGSMGTIWTSLTDGPGSGLDADTVDGYEAAVFPRKSVLNTFTKRQDIDISAAPNGDFLRVHLAAGEPIASLLLTRSGASQPDGFRVWDSDRGSSLFAATQSSLDYLGNTVWHSGNDGPSSGLDADTLDGQEASAFASASHTHGASEVLPGTFSAGDFTFQGDVLPSGQRHLGSESSPWHDLYLDGGLRLVHTGEMREVLRAADYTSFGLSISLGGGAMTVVGAGESADVVYDNDASNAEKLYLASDSVVRIETNLQNGWGSRSSWVFQADGTTSVPGDITFSGNTFWHEGNDGPGSGLNADLLDGQQATSFMSLSGSQTVSGDKHFSGTVTFSYGEGLEMLNGGGLTTLGGHSLNDTRVINIRDDNPPADGGLLFTADSGTTSDHADELLLIHRTFFEWKGNTIWHAGNHGPGSGLDADTLDGQEASAFASSGHDHTLDNLSGTLSVTKGGTGLTTVAAGDILYADASNSLASLPIGTNGKVLGVSAGTLAWVDQTSSSGVDHGSIQGLGDDDHSQYVHISTARNISAQHTFAPGAAQAPFLLGTNAQGELVSGLNAELLDGQEASAFASAGHNHDSDYLALSGGVLTGALTLGAEMVLGDRTASTTQVIKAAQSNYNELWLYQLNDNWRFWDNTAGSELLLLGTSEFSYKGQEVWHAGNDGAGSTLDADSVDGLDASSFVRADSADTAAGQLTFSHLNPVYFDAGVGTHELRVRWWDDTEQAFLLLPVVSGTADYGDEFGYNFTNTRWEFDSTPFVADSQVWHAGNDGASSGLNADLLDGYHASVFARKSVANTFQGDISFDERVELLNGGDSPRGNHDPREKFTAPGPNGAYRLTVEDGGGRVNQLWNASAGNGVYLAATEPAQRLRWTGGKFTFYSASAGTVGTTISWTELLDLGDSVFSYKGSTIWHSGNDGSGSGLNADLLDGQEASSFASSGHNHDSEYLSLSGGTLSGDLTVNATMVDLNSALEVSGLVTLGANITAPASSNRTKYILWGGNGSYGVGMASGMSFGAVDDYAMTFQMNDQDDRGFWWGDVNHDDAQGAMSLSTTGKLSLAHSFRVGYGEADTTIPGATHTLDVSGSGYLSGALEWGGGVAISSSDDVWTANNDGSGSGLDADTLDGQHAADLGGVDEATAIVWSLIL